MSNDVNFKRLDELEVIESSAENAHVLAEVNGVPKRIPASSVGGGSNMVEKIVFEGQGVEFSEMYEGAGVYGFIEASDFTYIAGRTYFVEWDGELYECVAFAAGDAENPITGIGNMALAEPSMPGTGEPFVSVINDRSITLVSANTEPTHDVKIYTLSEKISGGAMRVNISWDGENYSFDKTYEEISEAIAANAVVYCVFDTTVYYLKHSDAFLETSTYAMKAYTHFFSNIDYYGNMEYFAIGSKNVVTHGTRELAFVESE